MLMLPMYKDTGYSKMRWLSIVFLIFFANGLNRIPGIQDFVTHLLIGNEITLKYLRNWTKLLLRFNSNIEMKTKLFVYIRLYSKKWCWHGAMYFKQIFKTFSCILKIWFSVSNEVKIHIDWKKNECGYRLIRSQSSCLIKSKSLNNPD